MKLVVWQSVLTEHQLHLMRGLCAALEGELYVVVGATELQARKAQGWTAVAAADLNVYALPQRGWWQFSRRLVRERRDAIHIFCGLWGDRRFLPVMAYAQWQGCRTALMTEPYAEVAVGYFSDGTLRSNRLKVSLRPLFYRCAGFWLGARTCAVFAISTLAAKQFAAAGFAAERIYPFGYFVPAAPTVVAEALPSTDQVRLIFVGSVIQRKGIHILLAALAAARNALSKTGQKLTLDIYGPGESPPALTAGASFKGSIPFGKTQEVIAHYDALVLPSLHDGWGVVVNEALLQGVPALVSDAVGAQALIGKSGAGAVTPVGDIDALAARLSALAANPDLLREWKKAAKSFSPTLEPPVAAAYMLACLAHASGKAERPQVPWYLQDEA